MELRIKINLDNAAFEDGQGAEIARVLGEYAEQIKNGEINDFDLTHTFRDLNGNMIGRASLVR